VGYVEGLVDDFLRALFVTVAVACVGGMWWGLNYSAYPATTYFGSFVGALLSGGLAAWGWSKLPTQQRDEDEPYPPL
jgi:hypothetical protein